jgi:thymidylate synthase (FAD)
MKIVTTRDIGRQILRHRSFSFQEFSQRYAIVDTSAFISREARLQDHKNRQNSLLTEDEKLHEFWRRVEKGVANLCIESYELALDAGIAKEQARALLPEGLTPSTMYMSGSLRSWIHYCDLRSSNGTQKEHQKIAIDAWQLILQEFPSLGEVLCNR